MEHYSVEIINKKDSKTPYNIDLTSLKPIYLPLTLLQRLVFEYSG